MGWLGGRCLCPSVNFEEKNLNRQVALLVADLPKCNLTTIRSRLLCQNKQVYFGETAHLPVPAVTFELMVQFQKSLILTTVSIDCDCPLTVDVIYTMEYGFLPLTNGLLLQNYQMFLIFFLKVPSERLKLGASFLCLTQFSTLSH